MQTSQRQQRGSGPQERDPAPTVRPLSGLTGTDIGFAGERGVRIAAQSPTPPAAAPGFVIGVTAYEQLRDSGDLRCRLVEALCDVSAADRGRLMGGALLARSLVGAEPLPDALSHELERAYRGLVGDDRDAPVLVSVSEPTPVGVEGPVVEVHGTGSFFRAVRHCWAALYDPRRVLARAQRGLPQIDTAIAIVVQRLPKG